MGLFLKKIELHLPEERTNSYRFNVPAFQNDSTISVTSPFLVFAGENGVGKSTLLAAIAQQGGFNPNGGNQNHHFGELTGNPLSECITLGWSKKIRHGFYLRADRLKEFQRYLETISETDPSIFDSYGGADLSEQSHGEGIFALYQHHFRNGIFLLDEPETALSFKRKLSFISILKTLAKKHGAQFIMATHSPVIMSIPEAQLICMDEGGLTPCSYIETEIHQTHKLFFDAPERFHKHL